MIVILFRMNNSLNRKPVPSKMRPLATTRFMLTWFSMCSPDKSTTPRQKNHYIAHTSAVLSILVIGCVTCLAYCFTFFSRDFEGATYAFMVAVAQFGAIYAMIATIQMRDRIDDVLTNLSTIYRNSKLHSINYSIKLADSSWKISMTRWEWGDTTIFDSSQRHERMDVDNLLWIR